MDDLLYKAETLMGEEEEDLCIFSFMYTCFNIFYSNTLFSL